MRRDEFMRELEYLLQDIPDEDKADAVAYYQDYLDEAGPEEEDQVIRSFGSPERIAAIIRADLNGNLEEGGEFTDQGYEDERFREPNFQLVKRLDLPEQPDETSQANGTSQTAGTEQTAGTGQAFGGGGTDHSRGGFRYGGHWSGYKADQGAGASRTAYGYGTGRFRRQTGQESGQAPEGQAFAGQSGTGSDARRTGGSTSGTGRPRWSWWQIAGMILLIPIGIPLLFGIGGGALGLIAGLGGGAVGLLAAAAAVLLTVTIALAAVTFALLLAGVLIVIVGIGHLANLPQGFLYIGTGVGILGVGFLCLALCGLYYGRFLPWLGRIIIDSISRLIHRKGASAA